MLINGATRRQRPVARSVATTETSNVTPAIAGPAAGGAPVGTSWTLSNAMGNTLTAISIVTLPETTGVKIRRSVGSHQASAIWTKLQTTIRVANIAGPAAMVVGGLVTKCLQGRNKNFTSAK